MVPDPRPRLHHVSDSSSGTGSDHGELLTKLQAGDQASLSALYRSTANRVFGLSLQILRDWQLAEEATLDTYAQVWRTAKNYNPTRGSVLVWLLAIARSRALDVLRSHDRYPNADDIAAVATDLATRGTNPADTAADADQADALRYALRDLPRGQREALAAAYFGGMSHPAIAETLDVPIGTVKSRIRRGLSSLRNTMNPSRDLQERRDDE